MSNIEKKWDLRQKRHWRVRKNVSGTADRPRLSIYRSLKHVHAQIIDDEQGKTLCALSTTFSEIRKNYKNCGNIAAAKDLGKRLGEIAIAKGITKIVFDRGCFAFHGRIKAIADSARKAGLKF